MLKRGTNNPYSLRVEKKDREEENMYLGLGIGVDFYHLFQELERVRSY